MADDKKSSEAPTAEYISPLAKDANWGIIDAEPIQDDRFTDTKALADYIKSKIHDFPDVQYTMDWANFSKGAPLADFNDIQAGNYGWLRDRFGLDVEVRITGVVSYPQEPEQVPQLTFGTKMKTAADNQRDIKIKNDQLQKEIVKTKQELEDVKNNSNIVPMRDSVYLDLSKSKELFQYDHYKDHLNSNHDYAMQYVKSVDGDIYSSHHYQNKSEYPDGTVDAVEFVRRDSKGNRLDDMVVWNAPHGSSFGLIKDNGHLYICHPVFDEKDDVRTTYLAKIPYFPNAELKSDDGRIKRLVTRKRSISVAYDNDSDYYVSRNSTGGQVDVMEGEDVLNGEFTSAYSFNVRDFGIDINNQTVQSMDLKMPYLFINSGDIDMHDKRMIYCFNVVSKKLIFAQEVIFNDVIKAIGDYQEPEAVSIHKEANGSFSLWLGFNMGSKAKGHTEIVYTVPITFM